MIKKIVPLLLSVLSLSQPAKALPETAPEIPERWMVYDRVTPDGKPLVIVARTGNVIAQELLLRGHATVVTCRPVPTLIDDQGMPQGTDRLYALEDRIDDDPALLASGALRVASVTGQGLRRMFIVHHKSFDLSPLLQSTGVDGYFCAASDVADRDALIRLVTPTPLESQLNGDQDVISNLQKSGDDGYVARKADFWFFGQRTSLLSLAGNLKAHGFVIDRWLSDPTGIVLSRIMPVDLTAFQEITPFIIGAAEHSAVDYDGWETVVVSLASMRPGSSKLD